MERMAYEFCEDAYYAGIVYAEVRYSPELALGSKAMKEVGPQGNVQDFRYIYLKVSLFILLCMNIWMQHYFIIQHNLNHNCCRHFWSGSSGERPALFICY